VTKLDALVTAWAGAEYRSMIAWTVTLTSQRFRASSPKDAQAFFDLASEPVVARLPANLGREAK